MFKVNQTQFIEGDDFYHRVAFSTFNADECDDYSVVGAMGLQYRRDPGRDAVVMSSHIYYGFLPLDIPTQPKHCLGD